MSASHDHRAITPGRVEEVAEGVFAYIQRDGSWMINNTGFLPARDGVTAIDAVDYGDLQLTLPFLTFADRLTLWADELRCELLYAGRPRAHEQRHRGVDTRAPGAVRG